MDEVQGHPFHLSVNAPPEVGIQDSRVMTSNGLIQMPQLNERFGSLRWLFLLVRQKVSWSPVLIAGEIWRFLSNISAHQEILKLLKLRPFDEIAQNNPGIVFKYVARDYLTKGFTVTERISCFLHHYRRMHAALPECVLRQILQREVAFYEISIGDNCFALTLGLPGPPFDKEGELSLGLHVDDRKIFDMSFTIAPGWVVKSRAAEILLITRLQGMPECRPQIRLVRKGLREYSPKKLLLAALQGFADAFGIGEFAAVCATNQRSYGKHWATILERSYDGFFATLGMTKTAAGFYCGATPIDGKPLASFTGRNRSRARKRRAIRQQLRSACAAFLLGATGRAAHCSPGALNSTEAWVAIEAPGCPVSCSTLDCKVN
jgi:uncharacterized protein VirK/YbjX